MLGRVVTDFREPIPGFNPLLAIGATIESLVREPMNDRQKRMLNSAANEISRLDMTLKRYLSQRNDMNYSRVRLADVLSDVNRLLTGTRRLQGKQISVQVDRDVFLKADYESLKHLFFNLVLTNALL